MKTVSVETATLADAVQRAVRVAPTKGAAYDKAQGILFELRPQYAPGKLSIKATNLESTYYQRVAVLATGDESADWRLPSALLAGILSGLPLGAGKKVALGEKDGFIHLRCGRSRAKLRLIADPDAFPLIQWFDPTGMQTVTGFPRRLAQVSWACDRDGDVLKGVHIDGTNLYGCDRHKLAVVPCEVPFARPITVPLDDLVPLLKNTLDVRLRARDRRLELMPDDDTQMTSVIYGGAYPKVEGVMRDNFDGQITVDRVALLEGLNRMLVVVKGERYPLVRFDVSENLLKYRMEVPGVGLMTDELDVAGGGSPDFTIHFAPLNVINALAVSPKDSVVISYGPSALNPVRLADDGGFTSYLMPVKAASAAVAA